MLSALALTRAALGRGRRRLAWPLPGGRDTTGPSAAGGLRLVLAAALADAGDLDAAIAFLTEALARAGGSRAS
jgi:hypothetical protein